MNVGHAEVITHNVTGTKWQSQEYTSIGYQSTYRTCPRVRIAVCKPIIHRTLEPQVVCSTYIVMVTQPYLVKNFQHLPDDSTLSWNFFRDDFSQPPDTFLWKVI